MFSSYDRSGNNDGFSGKRRLWKADSLSAETVFSLFRRLRCICVCRKAIAAIVVDGPAPFDAALKLAVDLFQAGVEVNRQERAHRPFVLDAWKTPPKKS